MPDTNVGERSQQGDLVQQLRALYTRARDSRRDRYDSWRRNLRILQHKRPNDNGPTWVPRPRDSEVYPICSALAAWMTDQLISADYQAAAPPGTAYASYMNDLADNLQTIMQSNIQVLDYRSQIKLAIFDTFVTGVGIFKNVWDQTIDDGFGNALLKRIDPWNFYPDPAATCMDDGSYFIEARMMSVDEIERRWPGSGLVVEAISSGESPTNLDERPSSTGDNSRRPMTMPGALPSSNGQTRWSSPTGRGPRTHDVQPTVVVYEFWLRENDEWLDEEDNPSSEKHVAERWRVVVMAAGQILMDEYADDLWDYGSHPYERFVWEDLGEFYGVALIDHLADPQIYINRLLTAMQHNAELVGNPILIESPRMERQLISNRPGTRIPIAGAGPIKDNAPYWMEPPQLPAYIQDLVQFYIERMMNVSGLDAAMKGAKQPNRMAEGTMSSIQEAAFVRVRSALANMEASLTKCFYKLSDLIIENFDDPRVMAIVGPQGQANSIALHSRHFMVPTEKGAMPLKYAIVVNAGANEPTSLNARESKYDKLYTMGGLDRRTWLESKNVSNVEQIMQRIKDDMQAGMFNPPGARQRAGRSS